MKFYGKIATYTIVILFIFIGFLTLKNILGVNIYSSIRLELFPPIVGTILITFFSVAIATPVGVVTGIFISEYCSLKIKEFLIFIFKMLSSLPSILYGLFGFIMMLTINKIFNSDFKPCFFLSALSLSFLILPYIVHATIVGFSQIDFQLRELPLTLGAKKYQAIFKVYLPEAISFISSGIALAIGRAAEDTAVIMLTGVAAFAGIPSSLLAPYEALPFFIFYSTQENVTNEKIKLIYLAALIIIVISSIFIFLSKKVRFIGNGKFNTFN